MSRELRVSALLGRPARDPTGAVLGRVADLITERDTDGRERVVALVVPAGRWGRLLGYERAGQRGPWLLERFARLAFRRGIREVPWSQVRVES
jgi:hypothetical protein